MANKVIFGDAVDGLKLLESESVDTCITSPPYYNLRDYGKDGQIGLETSPEEYIEKLVSVFREVRRVLKPDGTLWVNIADSYAGSRAGGVVLDPFCGSATTLKAAKACGRNGIGIELNDEYETIIAERIGDYTRINAEGDA